MNAIVLVDSNVIIDISAQNSSHSEWSRKAMRRLRAEAAQMVINPIILAETTNDFADSNSQLAFLDSFEIGRRALPFTASFPAGRAHWLYRRSGGKRIRTLPDFLIGAHALAEGLTLLTRDEEIYRAYFPMIDLISPGTLFS